MKQKYFLVSLSLALATFVSTPVWAQTESVVKLEKGNKIVTVGNAAVQFYDDGGKEGNITKNLEGSVTFKPEDSSKKIMIDFTKMSIAKGSMYGQTVYVYNGSTTDAANLLATFNDKEIGKVRSSSADGALTVKLKNNAYMEGAGWEATVTQFAPQPMKYAGIDITQFSTGTVCAGDKSQAILSFNIKTEELSPVLTTKKFRFNTNGTQAQVTHATLYYTKASNAFATTKKIGEVDVTGNEFEITTTEALELFEGNNYFWLTYDINEMVLDGQKIDAALTNFTLSDGDHAVGAEGNPAGDRTVENIVYVQTGKIEKKVNGSLVYKTKSGYGSSHEGFDEDRIITFVPMHDGKIIQIDFSKFNLSYSSSTGYGVRAVFEIYSGKDTKGEKLWEVDSKTAAENGPGKTIRSKSADGAITIRFNAKSTTSYYLGKGIEATVSEYESKPMAVKEVTANQTSTDIIAAGDKNQDIISFNVKTEGDKDALKLNGVAIDLKESKQSIEKITIFSTGSKDEVPGKSAIAIATITDFGTDNTVNATFTTPVDLTEGDNWFRVRYDIKDNAEAEKKIDAAVASVNINGTSQPVTTADPKGERIIKSIFNLKSGENGTKIIPENGTLMFYDDGGEKNKASINFNGTVTFAPEKPGYGIKLTVKDWKMVYGNNFNVSYGGEAKATPDAKFGYYDKLESIITKSQDGKLTVNFTTGRTSGEGFAIEVSSVPLTAIAVKSVKTVAVTKDEVLKGQTNLPMMRIDVEAEGDYGTIDVTKFVVNADQNSIITRSKVYATDTVSTFATANLIGEATANPYEINGTYTIADRGVYKFWVAYDLSTAANLGDKASAALTNVTIGGVESTPESAVTATTTIKEGIKGTISVGAKEKYKTIQSAIDALNDGIEGPVTISIKPGIYKEHVNVPEIPGMSENNTLTIESSTGNPSDVKIYNDRYADSGYSDDKMAREYGIFTFDGADYVTLRGVEITTEKIDYPSVVHLRNMSQHVTVDNCYIHAPITTNNQQDVNLVYMYSINKANCNNDYFTLKNSVLDGGYIGVKLGGTSNVNLPKETGAQVLNNIIRNNGTKGIYLMKEDNAKIIGNTLENTTTTKGNFLAADIQSETTMQIENNKFILNITPNTTALSIRSINATADKPATIVNNSFVLNTKDNSSAAIKISSPSSNINIAHNTVRVIGKTTAPALWFNDNMDNVTVTQNIFLNEAGGYVYRFYKTENIATVKYSKNNVYTTGSVFAFDKSNIAKFADWTTKSNEADSYNETVEFLDEKILEPKNEGNLLKTVALAYVTKDINGTARNASTPTMGAYEYNASTAAPVMAADYPSVTNITDSTANVNVKADMNAKAYIVVKKKGEAAPTKEEVIAANNVVTVSKDEKGTYNATGLIKDETYVAYAVLVSLRNAQGEVVASKEFKATSSPAPIELKAPKVVANDNIIEAGSAANLTATITEGKAPYTVKWLNGKHEEVATDVVPTENDDYIILVTDANGMTATDTCRVYVTGNAVTATFENLYLDNESHWSGPNKYGSFVSGSYEFDNGNMPEWNYWYNFGYSNETSTKYKGLADQFHSAVGAGVDGSENYAVAYPQGGKITVINKEDGDSIRGFYITNTAWVVDAVKNGDGSSSVAGGFQKGDYYKLTVTGKAKDGKKKNVEYYLVDYRSEKEADRYVLESWQWVDLRTLGAVQEISFKLEGTKKNTGGLTTPAYFCMDNFNGTRKITDAASQEVSDTISIAGLFTPDGSNATIKYELADSVDNSLATSVEVTKDGKLVVKGTSNKNFSVIVKMTQAGKIQFVRIPVNFTPTGITSVGEDADNGAIRIENGQIIVNAGSNASVQVYTTTGVLVANAKGNARLDVAQGLYIVKVTANGKSFSKNVIIQ